MSIGGMVECVGTSAGWAGVVYKLWPSYRAMEGVSRAICYFSFRKIQ